MTQEEFSYSGPHPHPIPFPAANMSPTKGNTKQDSSGLPPKTSRKTLKGVSEKLERLGKLKHATEARDGPRQASISGDHNSARMDYPANKIDIVKNTYAIDKRIMTLAAFIPDFMLRQEASRKVPNQRSHEAVVFMVDVSGFTALTEAYSLKGIGGMDQLTKTLMGYIAPLAEAILACQGDIVKYAGDAFLAIWNTNVEHYPQTVQRAIDCALYIQEKYGSYLCKEVDITIKVKVGIGAGTVHLCGIGNDQYQHYECFGPGVEAASESEKNCSSGEVILHSETWKHCNPTHYKAPYKTGTFRHVTQIITFINPDKRGRPMPKPGGRGDTIEAFVRPAIFECIKNRSEDYIRRFILPPVLTKVDDDIPLEYLNESRVTTICFIHVSTVPMSHEGVAFRETMVQIVNKCFVKIYQLVTKMQGALTKVIMFDKGLTYLVAFGLPGFINEHQCVHALKFSHSARRNLLSQQGVEEVSIGVTSGACWCGVLGHPKRQEYTIMGRKVNKAARLMCYYPGMVACDQDTAYHSKLDPSNFEIQEYRQLKGIANPGKIYEFLNLESQEDNSVPIFLYPMVGRDAPLRIFRDVLAKQKKELEEHNQVIKGIKGTTMQKEVVQSKGVWMMIFEGENGIGKSRLLAACLEDAEKIPQVFQFSVTMNLMLSGQTLFAVTSLIMDAAGIAGFRTSAEREDFLRKKVTETDLLTDLCVCNDVLRTKFTLPPKYINLDANSACLLAQHVLLSLLKIIYPTGLVILAVDDAHFLDQLSWEYLLGIAKCPHVLCLFALRKNATGTPKIAPSIQSQIYRNKNIKIVRLGGLDLSHCKTLACQIMEVSGIPADLEKVLHKSQGVPAWCDQVLHELLRTGVLEYSTNPKNRSMVYVDKNLLRKSEPSKKARSQKAWVTDADFGDSTSLTRSVVNTRAPELKTAHEEVIDASSRVLIVKSGTNIGHIELHGTLNEFLLDLFDELNSNEQIILKCASVLGRKFSRAMVTQILPFFEVKTKSYEAGFNRLMQVRHIKCASGVHSKHRTGPPQCFCKDNTKTTTKDTKPKFWSCKFMEFEKDSFREVVYGLITEDVKKEFHLKAAKYLDIGGVQCESCGGQNIAYAYGITLNSNANALDTEDALRANTAAKRRSRDHGSIAYKMRQEKDVSLETQIAGMKRKFKSDGSKVRHIEMEILTLLRKVGSQERRRHRLCCRGSVEDDATQELNEELRLLKDSEDSGMVRLNPSTPGANERAPLLKTTDSVMIAKSSASLVDESESSVSNIGGYSNDNVDLRLCNCSALRAKIAIELVRHYHVAEKYGKCLVNLLEAAESAINIGNGSQGLVNLEDAAFLLDAIQTGAKPRPEKSDQDDVVIDAGEVEGQIQYLNGLALFEIGVFSKSKEYFLKALARLGLKLTSDSDDDQQKIKPTSVFKAKLVVYTSQSSLCCPCLRGSRAIMEDDLWNKKLRILGYLHSIYKKDRELESALAVSIWEQVIAKRYGDPVHDLIPAYCNTMTTQTAMGNHKSAKKYERLCLELIRRSYAANNEELDPTVLLTTAGLFHAISQSRLCRGEIQEASETAYLGLRIGQTIHDNNLMSRLLQPLAISLLFGLRISELVDALRKLWYIAEEDDNRLSMTVYYSLCLDFLLRTAYPLEPFVACEAYVINNDWDAEGGVYKDLEILFGMEASLALWYARYSRWEDAQKWLHIAYSHRPKLESFVTLSAELKILECQLIFVNHYVDSKRYQNFSKARNMAKETMRTVTKSIKIAPVCEARFVHLLAYYHKIRSRNADALKHLNKAEKLARKMNNEMELHWILHNRMVWNNETIPTVKFFWLEHTETHTIDWQSSGKTPWANVMFSLPVPTSN